jgi:hypothetical protein
MYLGIMLKILVDDVHVDNELLLIDSDSIKLAISVNPNAQARKEVCHQPLL